MCGLYNDAKIRGIRWYVRKARTDDEKMIEEVRASSMNCMCTPEYGMTCMKYWMRSMPNLSIDWNNVHLVAEEGGAIIGYARYNPTCSVLEALYVIPSRTRSGVGKVLLNAIEGCARRIGAKDVTLISTINAVQFYSGNGYCALKWVTWRCFEDVIRGVTMRRILEK